MEDLAFSYVLPNPPAVNNLYFDRIIPPNYPERPRPIVKRVLTDEGREFKETVARFTAGCVPFVGEVWVILKWYRPRRIGDIDGILKIILDGMSGHVYADDKQVARLHVDRFEDAKRPRVEVEIRPLDLC